MGDTKARYEGANQPTARQFAWWRTRGRILVPLFMAAVVVIAFGTGSLQAGVAVSWWTWAVWGVIALGYALLVHWELKAAFTHGWMTGTRNERAECEERIRQWDFEEGKR